MESTFSIPPTLLLVEFDRLFWRLEREALVDPPAAPPDIDMVATADVRAASPPWESTMVVIQEFSGSGGSRTRVIIPGTTSEKCLDTKVEMREDFPTPSKK